ncbi:G-type lectin S-receptor-like serine/threonine-protein kinase [Glycine soja]|nr:G-type lectin S-receptor-like serine/threonine-protein kinase [Glycine soja]
MWESFRHPCHALVPKMKLSITQKTYEKVRITSWRSPSDPSLGYYSATLERPNIPEVFYWINETQPYYRTGPWNGQIFIGSPQMSRGYLYGWNMMNDEDDGTVYLSYNLPSQSYFAVMTLNPQGHPTIEWWRDRKLVWREVLQGNSCDRYGHCGAFGSCNWQSSPICNCLSGYKPKYVEEWNRKNWTSGCVRSEPLQCGEQTNGSEVSKDGFLRLENMKVSDFVQRLDCLEDECRAQCLENCSCVAYAYDNGIGCMVWSGDLIDIQKFSSGGIDLYIRVPPSESELEKHSDKRRHKTILIPVGITIGMVALAGCVCLSRKWTAKSIGKINSQRQGMNEDQKQVKLNDHLPFFSFEELVNATNNFHSANELGKGGFGSVYKGQLKDGHEIAVKRLSKTSGQGLEECMNEVLVISRLQHRNLVRLLGCCIEQEENMLVYEYMPNKSLDVILFDPAKKQDLDWPKRFNIIEGISRGLLYLHRDSRIKIIHRDLKVSNILLDGELNPKISDFGMAKIFGGNDMQANTRRVVGTFGYMPPEYAFQGLVSEKLDVFGFGVLLLEIISGRKISSCFDHDQSLSLLGFAWKLWNEKDIQSLIDPEISNPNNVNDIVRCIHIGLLCSQELAKERPLMATVVSMLNSEIVDLPPPLNPAFIKRQIVSCADSSQQNHITQSINNVTVTGIQGR